VAAAGAERAVTHASGAFHMALESGSHIADLNTANPAGTDPKSQGDDHIRLLKSVLRNSFAGFPGAVMVTGTETQGADVNDYVVSISPAPGPYATGMIVLFKATHANTGAATLTINALAAKALKDVDGEALAAGDIPSGGAVAALYDGTDFLLVSGNDRVARAGDSYTGAHDFAAATVTAATPAAGDNSAKVATTAYVDAADALKAPLASPALTGTPTAPTPATGDDSTRIATTEFVNNVATNAALPSQAGNAGKFLQTDGVNGNWNYTVASTVEAQAGASSTALMTALRTKQAIESLSPPISVIIQDQRSSGVDGSVIAAGTWAVCPFNTKVRDPFSLASVSSNQITLQPGQYEIRARRSICWTLNHDQGALGSFETGAQLRLYDLTNSFIVGYGETLHCRLQVGAVDSTTIGDTFTAEIVAVVDVHTASVFRLEVFCQPTARGQLNHGLALSTGSAEVYGTFEAKRTADA
jgi:hypothetical protein